MFKIINIVCDDEINFALDDLTDNAQDYSKYINRLILTEYARKNKMEHLSLKEVYKHITKELDVPEEDKFQSYLKDLVNKEDI